MLVTILICIIDMKILVDEIHGRAIIEIDPNDYFLVKSRDEFAGVYALAQRIDMAYKGKDDQEGMSVIYLSKEEAEKFRRIGMVEIM